jgi:diguanylate cyclase (GGDEF)-like protein
LSELQENFTGRDPIISDHMGKDRLFPLEFLCRYVIEKKEDLLRSERMTEQQIHKLRQESESMLQEMKSYWQDSESSAEVISELLARQERQAKQLATLEQELKRENGALEKITGMLDQTESLIQNLVYRDALTGAYNRYFLASRINDFFKKAKEGASLSMAFIDVDNFRDFNTRFGHDFGDTVLREIRMTVVEDLNQDGETYFIRAGGDEFLLIDIGMPFEKYIVLVEKIRHSVETLVIRKTDDPVTISVSIGVANAQRDNAMDYPTLSRIADRRLYLAKSSGKNNFIYEGAASITVENFSDGT